MSASDVVMFSVAGGIALYLTIGVAQGYAWLLGVM